MTSDRTHVGDYPFTGRDRLFLDTNVWLALFGPNAECEPGHTAYTDAWRAMLSAGSQVFIDAIVVSEFFDASLRQVFRKSGAEDEGVTYKDWRGSGVGRHSTALAANSVTEILAQCSWCKRSLPKSDILAQLTEIVDGRLDLNDRLIARLCEREGYTLLVHDYDFRSVQVPLLTALDRLLR